MSCLMLNCAAVVDVDDVDCQYDGILDVAHSCDRRFCKRIGRSDGRRRNCSDGDSRRADPGRDDSCSELDRRTLSLDSGDVAVAWDARRGVDDDAELVMHSSEHMVSFFKIPKKKSCY